MPAVALSAHLASVLPRLPETDRDRVLRALHKIQQNQFDSGLRVKKLRSRPSVAVWEARFSDYGRLLFTYGKHADRMSQTPKTMAHVWTAVFDHDDVSRQLRRKQFEAPETMRWLHAGTIDEAKWDRTPIPENPAADLEAIEEDFPARERWDAYAALSSEYDPAWTTPPENLPWYLEGKVAFETWADGQNIPAELILTDEQLDLLRKPLPVFLNGPAGSGKTTLALYRLLVLQENNPDAKVAFVAHNPRLVTHAEELYRALPTRPERATPVDFLTYRDLVVRVLNESFAEIQRQLVSPDRLRKLLSHRDLTKAERQLFETEIRAILKGMLPPRTRPPRKDDVCQTMSGEQYQSLPVDWSAVPEEKRGKVYRLAEQYQRDIEPRGKDLQDISTEALRRLLSGEVPRRYDALVIDEVQDLTEKQLRVAMATLQRRSWDQVLLAGDPTQVLNGSGFGWRIPRALFYERRDEVPSPHTLTRSFRAGAPTLCLPQALADRLRKEGADVVALDPSKARSTGRLPVRVFPGTPVDDTLADGHPDVLILTDDEETASQLRTRWGHPFVWSVAEAKGLEADHVVLYKLPDRLRKIPGAKPADRKAARRVNHHHLRLHYVAATRARKSITAVVHPHPGDSLWEDSSIQKTVDACSFFEAPWREAPSKEQWNSRAEYYRDQEQWPAAAECFGRAEKGTWKTICQLLHRKNNVTEALSAIRQEVSDLAEPQATFLLEHVRGSINRVLRIWLLRQARREKEANALQAKYDEERGRWGPAAHYYRENGEYERAARLFMKAKAWKDAARCFDRVDSREWERVCSALDTHRGATAVVQSVQDAVKRLSKPCAQFLLDQVGTVDDINARIWLLECAGESDQLEEYLCHNKNVKETEKVVQKDRINIKSTQKKLQKNIIVLFRRKDHKDFTKKFENLAKREGLSLEKFIDLVAKCSLDALSDDKIGYSLMYEITSFLWVYGTGQGVSKVNRYIISEYTRKICSCFESHPPDFKVISSITGKSALGMKNKYQREYFPNKKQLMDTLKKKKKRYGYD